MSTETLMKMLEAFGGDKKKKLQESKGKESFIEDKAEMESLEESYVV